MSQRLVADSEEGGRLRNHSQRCNTDIQGVSDSAASGVQYIWTSWSDHGEISHVVAPPTTNNAKFVANFQLQYFLTMAVSGSGQVKPMSAWQNAGTVVTIQARASQGSRFSSWMGMGPGSFTGTSNPASVTMNGPITETAIFSP